LLARIVVAIGLALELMFRSREALIALARYQRGGTWFAGIVVAIGLAHELMFGSSKDGKGDKDKSKREFHRCE